MEVGDVKIVVSLKGDRASVGVQAPDSDPIITVVDGGLDAVFSRLPELIEQARNHGRNPKCERPPSQQERQQPAPQRVSTPQRRSDQMSLF